MASKTKDSGPTAEEINDLIGKLAAYRPLADFLRALGVNPKSDDARRLSAYALVYLTFGAKKLRREAKPAKSSKWTDLDDFALQIEMLRLRYEDGLSERKAIAKLAATWPFPYSPQTGRHSSKANPKKQREDALWHRWMNLKRQRKAFEEAQAKFGHFAHLFGADLAAGETRMSGQALAIHQRRVA